MNSENLSLSETIQIHEILNMNTICMTTAKMMEGVVFDQDLKALLEKDSQQTVASIKDLQKLLPSNQASKTGGAVK